MILKKHFLLFCFSLLLVCCKQKSQKLDKALKLAGNNRSELEKVIKHYQAPKDSLKLKAAYFLMENMDNKFCISMGNSKDKEYRKSLNKLVISNNIYPWYPTLSKIPSFLDSINQKYTVPQYSAISDLKSITSGLLIKNIDLAFEEWNSVPWKNKYSTDDFFQWVLPYRASHEPLEDWRGSAIEMAQKIPFVSIPSKKVDSLYAKAALSYSIGMSKCLLSASFNDIKNIKYADCQQYANFSMLLFRANGIPSAVDCVPVWANRSGIHYWTVMILPHGESKTKEISFSNKVSKIYRKKYAVQRNDILYQYRATESIPAFFSNFDLIDVTEKYPISTSTVVVNNLNRSDSKLVWLSTFNNFNWLPVAYAERSWGEAVFKNVGQGCYRDKKNVVEQISSGKGIVYLPSYYTESGIVAASAPLILKEDGTIKTLEIDTVKKQSLFLSRKYPKQKEFDILEQNMIGGYFEGSNNADFKFADTLLIIKKKQNYPMEKFEIPLSKSYRYIRFVKKNPDISIAELCFYSNTIILKGSPIATKSLITKHDLHYLFDGLLDMYVPIKDTSTVWVGLDFGKATKVTAISFSSRTDDNDITLGDTYELSYWNHGWVSVGSQIANEHVLRWDKLPSNTLYLFRNLSRGVEQRIFTYDKGKLLWW